MKTNVAGQDVASFPDRRAVAVRFSMITGMAKKLFLDTLGRVVIHHDVSHGT